MQNVHVALWVLLVVFVISGCQSTDTDMLSPTPIPADISLSPTNTSISETPTVAPAVETYTDLIEYRGKFHIQQILSVRLPEETTPPYPTVLMFHSGGFSTGDKMYLDEVAEDLSRRGFAAVNVNYHLHPYPAPLNNAFCALAWVYAEAQTFEFDINRVIAFDVDSGGSLAALLGLITNPMSYLEECPNTNLPAQAVAGVVSYSGVYDYAAEDELGFDIMRAVEPYLRATVEGYNQRATQASPLTYVHTDAPPFLLIHGLDDSMVDIAQSERFANALQAVNVPVDFIKVPDVDHYILMEKYMPKPLTLEDMHLDKVEAWMLGL